MWITRTRWLFAGAAVGMLLAGVPVLAASDTFKEKATEFYQRHCTRGRATSIIAVLCYAFDKTGELDAQLGALTGRVGTLASALEENTQNDQVLAGRVSTLENQPAPEAKALRTFDAEGDELGLTVNLNQHFYEPIKRIMIVDPSKGELGFRIPIYFETPDCSGAAYLFVHGLGPHDSVHYLFSVGPGKYYIVERGTQQKKVQRQSELRWDGVLKDFVCERHDGELEMLELKPVTVPLPDPVPLPLEYRFE